jgi:RNA polymerase sigma-70 factor (ECF subfamily)
MMRITEISRSESVVRFRLEGRLTQITIVELAAAVEPDVALGTTVMLDLAGVTFADEAGIGTLRRLRTTGVVLVGTSSFVSEMLRVDDRSAAEPVDGKSASDGDLLARLRRGDDAAFAEVVERHGGRLFAAAKRVLRSDDEARDAVQDALLSAFRGLASFNGDARLSTWLHRIVINAALMRVRRRKHRAEQPIDGLLPRFDDDGSWGATLHPNVVSSLELLERRESRALVRRCIDQLPDTYRTVLLMRDIEDLDTDEVSEVLGVTPNAVKIRLHRARQALRSLIEHTLQQSEVSWSTNPSIHDTLGGLPASELNKEAT